MLLDTIFGNPEGFFEYSKEIFEQKVGHKVILNKFRKLIEYGFVVLGAKTLISVLTPSVLKIELDFPF